MHQTLCIIMLFALSASTLSMLPPRIVGMDKCITEHDVGEDFESKLLSDPEPLLRDPKTRCYATCILTAKKILNSDGTLNVAHMIETTPDDTFNRDNVIEVYKACANQAGKDNCERASTTVVCINSKKVDG